jgi:hypothetical protein
MLDTALLKHFKYQRTVQLIEYIRNHPSTLNLTLTNGDLLNEEALANNMLV